MQRSLKDRIRSLIFVLRGTSSSESRVWKVVDPATTEIQYLVSNMVNISTSYFLEGVLCQQVVQQVDILQPQSSHV